MSFFLFKWSYYFIDLNKKKSIFKILFILLIFLHFNLKKSNIFIFKSLKNHNFLHENFWIQTFRSLKGIICNFFGELYHTVFWNYNNIGKEFIMWRRNFHFLCDLIKFIAEIIFLLRDYAN